MRWILSCNIKQIKQITVNTAGNFKEKIKQKVGVKLKSLTLK